MRMGGIHGQKLQEKNEKQKVTEMIKIKPKPQKQEMRMGGTHGKKLEAKKKKEKQKMKAQNDDEEIERLAQNGSIISINATPRGTHQRVDILPPEGADGCVMFIEKRSVKEEVKPQVM